MTLCGFVSLYLPVTGRDVHAGAHPSSSFYGGTHDLRFCWSIFSLEEYLDRRVREGELDVGYVLPGRRLCRQTTLCCGRNGFCCCSCLSFVHYVPC